MSYSSDSELNNSRRRAMDFLLNKQFSEASKALQGILSTEMKMERNSESTLFNMFLAYFHEGGFFEGMDCLMWSFSGLPMETDEYTDHTRGKWYSSPGQAQHSPAYQQLIGTFAINPIDLIQYARFPDSELRASILNTHDEKRLATLFDSENTIRKHLEDTDKCVRALSAIEHLYERISKPLYYGRLFYYKGKIGLENARTEKRFLSAIKWFFKSLSEDYRYQIIGSNPLTMHAARTLIRRFAATSEFLREVGHHARSHLARHDGEHAFNELGFHPSAYIASNPSKRYDDAFATPDIQEGIEAKAGVSPSTPSMIQRRILRKNRKAAMIT